MTARTRYTPSTHQAGPANGCRPGARRLYMLVAVTLLATVSIPAATQAQTPSRGAISRTIDDLRRRYDEITREYRQGEEMLKEMGEKKQTLMRELDRHERTITSIRRNLNDITAEETRLDREIESARTQYDDARATLADRSAMYARVLRTLYMRQRVTPFQMIASAGSMSSALRGFRQFTALAQNDIRVLDEIRSMQRSIQESMERIELSRSAQQRLEKQKRREEQSLRKTAEERRLLITELNDDEQAQLALQKKYQDEMEWALKEIERRIQEANRVVTSREFVISDKVKAYNMAGRKGKLAWPADGKVSSAFGVKTDPRTGTSTLNRGIEIATRNGDSVTAVGDGIVVITDSIRGYGNYVVLYHPPNMYTIYGHLSDILVTLYQEVREGQIIGMAGGTGLVDDSISQLLFELLNGKNPEDPLGWLKTERGRTGG